MKTKVQGEGRKAVRALLAVATLTLLATPVLAHEGDHWPIAGEKLKLAWSANGLKTKFSFSTKHQTNINVVSLTEDPRTQPSTLIVRGTGALPGTTQVI